MLFHYNYSCYTHGMCLTGSLSIAREYIYHCNNNYHNEIEKNKGTKKMWEMREEEKKTHYKTVLDVCNRS